MRAAEGRAFPSWRLLLVSAGAAGVCVALLLYARSIPISPTSGATPAADSPVRDARIHVPMFIDPALVKPAPRFHFTFDAAETLAALRREERLDEVVKGAPDDLDRAVRLMAWTRRQWEPGRPDPYPPLDARIILRDIRRGFTGGFCAQYNYVLAQALQSLSIPARYASLIEHEVIEVWLRDRCRWICLDPLYDTYYTDESGAPLSVLETHRRLAAGRLVLPGRSSLIEDLPRHLGSFARFAVWLKNDHVGSPLNFTDLERYKVHFLDTPDDAGLSPPGALWTTEPADLYPGGVDRPDLFHMFCPDADTPPRQPGLLSGA